MFSIISFQGFIWGFMFVLHPSKHTFWELLQKETNQCSLEIEQSTCKLLQSYMSRYLNPFRFFLKCTPRPGVSSQFLLKSSTCLSVSRLKRLMCAIKCVGIFFAYSFNAKKPTIVDTPQDGFIGIFI